MAIVLRWLPFPGADVASYKVFRSIIGFHPPLVSLATIDGKTMDLKFDGGATQTVTFDSTTPIVDKINAEVTGGAAFLADDGISFFVRSDTREDPGSVEIVGGTALADFGETARVITEQSEEEQIAAIPALANEEEVVGFEDPDGVPQDYYRIVTVDSLGTDSLPTPYKQATSFSGAVCVIEGIIQDLQGVRIPDAEVIAKIVQFPRSQTTATHITKTEIKTLSGEDGRFSLALLQGAAVQICIAAIGMDRYILVPETPFEFLTNILQNTDYQYPLGVQ